MLCQFTFKNYKSYRDETTIEMQAENIDEFEETLIKSSKDNKSFLPVSVIYGPNAGGKSNAIEALVCLIEKVISPIFLVKSNIKIKSIDVVPYKFSSETEPTDFEIFYRINNIEFRYNISYLNEKIIYESLFILNNGAKKPAKIFIRQNNKIELGEELKKEKVNTNNNIDIPFISFLAISYNIKIIELAISFFYGTAMINCNTEKFEDYFIGLICEDKEIKKDIIKLFQNMDIDISDYRIEKDEEIKNKMKLFTKHIVQDKEYELNIFEESNGTIKLFALLPSIIISLKEGHLTIIDEMDAKLHPKLIKYIIEMYKNKEINTKGAQLIITSHNLTTMSKDVYRRDEILFAAKNQENTSELYSLYEIRDTNGEHIRATASYNKQYIEGRYGADPYLKK